MPRRAPETLADYLVVGICPALIMFLVGSLMWFLVDVFYQGEFKGRLIFVMAMFVMAIVAIARISMESGLERAVLFGGPFAAVIALAVMKFVSDGLIIAGPLMILVWWAAHKLTWDCTLMDDTQDASGQGLLQQMGLDRSAGPADPAPPGTTSRPGDIEAVTAVDQQPSAPWWERLFEPDRRPHAPGVWVVYFSLAALPLFGIGGWFVPASDPVARARVFGLLVIYVASGMGLLLATSFLGLRKYLRQRKLQMPMEMTSTWIIVGLVLIIGVLLAATILPRPSREYSLSQLPFTISSAARRASSYAFGKEGTKDDKAQQPATTEAKDSQATERQGGKGKEKSDSSADAGQQKSSGEKGAASGKGEGKSKGGEPSASGKSQSSGGDKGKSDQAGKSKTGSKSKQRDAESRNDDKTKQDSQSSDSDKQQQPSEQQQSEQSNEPKAQSDSSRAQPPSQLPSQVASNVATFLSQGVFTLFKWLFYLGLLITGLIVAWIYRDELWAAWQKLLTELRELWERWFGGGKKAAEEAVADQPLVAPPRTFASFVDPFATGDAARMPWPQLVRYTFEALEAWGREHACPREVGQTPYEFALAIASLEPQLSPGVQTLVNNYNQLAYARGTSAGNSPESLRELWHLMRVRQSPPVLAAT